MKQLSILILLTLVLVSCGTDSHHFEIDGRLTNLNQGEFYVYSPDDGITGIDTIKVESGRFTYEMPCDKPCILVIVFPNFSKQAIFAEPGKSVNIKGNASHLKELEIKGTDDNELMTKFRQQIASASPPEIQKAVCQFVNDNQESPVGIYLVSEYFISNEQPDYNKAAILLQKLHNKQPRNGFLNRLLTNIKSLNNPTNGYIGNFASSATINGGDANSEYLRKAPISVIYTWATWNFESMDLQRQLKNLYRKSNGKLKIIGINIDASRQDCKNTVARDSIKWPVICDRQMFEGNIVKELGMYAVPDNILLQNGKIIARSLSVNDLCNRIEKNI